MPMINAVIEQEAHRPCRPAGRTAIQEARYYLCVRLSWVLAWVHQ